MKLNYIYLLLAGKVLIQTNQTIFRKVLSHMMMLENMSRCKDDILSLLCLNADESVESIAVELDSGLLFLGLSTYSLVPGHGNTWVSLVRGAGRGQVIWVHICQERRTMICRAKQQEIVFFF